MNNRNYKEINRELDESSGAREIERAHEILERLPIATADEVAGGAGLMLIEDELRELERATALLKYAHGDSLSESELEMVESQLGQDAEP